VEGAEAEALGRFWHLFSRLRSSAESLARPRTVLQWQARLNRLLDEFFGERPDDEGRLQRFRDTVAELAEQAGDLEERLDPTLVRGWLQERLQNLSRHGRYLSGGVTFCGMRPMRSLPFPVVCVLGLQDQAFPRQDRFAEFDLMRSQWRQGDPRKADEDRYLFLETLLCARRRLYLSYVGRDIRTNKPRQPSVLLGELLDYLDQQFRIVTDGRQERPTEKLTRVHSLQPFSVRNYAAEPRSYDPGWCRVAEALARPTADRDTVPEAWPGVRLPEAPAAMREVRLVQLERFLRHPVRYFVNSRLQVYLGEEESEADEELFALDGLQRFLLRRRLVDERLRGRAASRQLLDAEGVLPHGACSDLAFEEQRTEVRPLLKRLGNYLGRKPMPLTVELDFSGTDGPRRLSGQVPGLYPDLGLLRWTTGSLKGADILALWMAHLACCAAGQPGDGPASLHGREQSFVIRHQPSPAEARDLLQACLGWYWEGVHRPLPLLPGASFAFARRSIGGGRADPMNEARSRWQGNEFRGIPGDRDDAYVALVMRGVAGDPLQSEEFGTLAKAIYGPALEAGEII
jgi:exodeoxyribonuclease V gamma subunit